MANGKPTRIQLSRRRGFKKPPEAIVVSRPTKWGNPHHVTRVGVMWIVGKYGYATREQAVRFAVRSFREDLNAGRLAVTVEDVKRELRGRSLACWCPPSSGAPYVCHADVLLEVANA